MIEKIKYLRVQLDGVAQLIKGLSTVQLVDLSLRLEGESMDSFQERAIKDNLGKVDSTINQSKELEKSYDSTILAKAWLGKVLEGLGNSTPYTKDGSRKDVKDIEPTADTVGGTFTEDYFQKNHIEKIDYLREEIKNLITRYIHLSQEIDDIPMVVDDNVYSYLCEARFWLGFELGRIRDNEPKTETA